MAHREWEAYAGGGSIKQQVFGVFYELILIGDFRSLICYNEFTIQAGINFMQEYNTLIYCRQFYNNGSCM